MNRQNRPDDKSSVKMIYKHFDNGTILKGRYAIPKGDDTYEIVREDKTTMTVKIGETVPKAGLATLDHNGNIRFGEMTIIVGNDPHDGYHLQRTNSAAKFKLYDPEGKEREIIVNSAIPELGGELVRGEDKKLYVNGRNIPIFTKQYEKVVLGLLEDRDGGKFTYFNTNYTKEPDANKKGIPGILVFGKENKPTTFQELGPDGAYYITAYFKPNEDGKTVTAKLRSLNSAIEDRFLIHELKKIKEEEVDKHGENPEDVQSYCDLRDRIMRFRQESSTETVFGVTKGHRLLGLKQVPRENLDKAPRP